MERTFDKNLSSIVKILKKELPDLRTIYGVETLSIFGSYSRGEENKLSDLDLLVTFTEPPGFFQYIRLENHLSELLGIIVDLVMKEALKTKISENITEDLVIIP
jgi:uncharacterized protein